MKRYTLFIVGAETTFQSDILEEIAAMICLGDKWTVVDSKTGATKTNCFLEIGSVLF